MGDPIDNQDSVAVYRFDRSTTFPVEIERQSRDQMEEDGRGGLAGLEASKHGSIIRDEKRELRQRAMGVNPPLSTLMNGRIHQSIHQPFAISWALLLLLLRFASNPDVEMELKSI